MDDRQIVELFWRRDESAIAETECKYGSFCLGIASSLLSSGEDAKDCVNETFYQAWKLMPPERPDKLRPWLGRIVRNIAVSLWRKNHRQKRFGGILPVRGGNTAVHKRGFPGLCRAAAAYWRGVPPVELLGLERAQL